VIWSNKYAPFKKVILVAKGLGQWIVRTDPETGQTLMFDLEPLPEQGKIDVTIKTVACYSLLNPSEGLLLNVPPRE
jgi:hypothetical protein